MSENMETLLNMLRQSGLVHAKRGYRGGFVLARPAHDISLLEVIEAVEGTDFLPECLLGLAACSDECGCPTRPFWQDERRRIRTRLAGTSLADVAAYAHRRVPVGAHERNERPGLLTSGDTSNG